ncbi:MAG: DUF1674 domain-containing protein [Gammaproteobacteria bacterium]
MSEPTRTDTSIPIPPDKNSEPGSKQPAKPAEIGGPKGLDPTRYGDWEKGGRCIDF